MTGLPDTTAMRPPTWNDPMSRSTSAPSCAQPASTASAANESFFIPSSQSDLAILVVGFIPRDEDRTREDQRAAGERDGGQRFAEEKPSPQHAEERDEVGHRQRAGRADVRDEAE